MHWFKVLLAVCALSGGPVLAEDLSDPPFPVGGVETSQVWEPGPDIYGSMPANTYSNPFGTPTINLDGGWAAMPEPEGPLGTPIDTWHVSPGGGQLVITIPNNPDPNLYKYVFWQITSDKSVTPSGTGPTSTPPGTNMPTGIPSYQWPTGTSDGSWYTYNGMIQIQPNPASETIVFDLVESTNIAEVVIDTTCVPEPATMGLLAVGLVALARRHR